MREDVMKKLMKTIQEANLTTNELYEIITVLQRIHVDKLVKENIIKYIDNIQYFQK